MPSKPSVQCMIMRSIPCVPCRTSHASRALHAKQAKQVMRSMPDKPSKPDIGLPTLTCAGSTKRCTLHFVAAVLGICMKSLLSPRRRSALAAAPAAGLHRVPSLKTAPVEPTVFKSCAHGQRKRFLYAPFSTLLKHGCMASHCLYQVFLYLESPTPHRG